MTPVMGLDISKEESQFRYYKKKANQIVIVLKSLILLRVFFWRKKRLTLFPRHLIYKLGEVLTKSFKWADVIYKNPTNNSHRRSFLASK
ncbi:hypothetical protein V7659_00475 [Neobacillus drentensis]